MGSEMCIRDRRTGLYELRYHHDGSHDVLARSEPFEIYVDTPHDRESYAETYASLSKIVHFALADSPPPQDANAYRSEDPDDLVFWRHDQVRHIAAGIQDAFGVEFSPEVIVADANLATLACNIVAARQLMRAGRA